MGQQCIFSLINWPMAFRFRSNVIIYEASKYIHIKQSLPDRWRHSITKYIHIKLNLLALQSLKSSFHQTYLCSVLKVCHLILYLCDKHNILYLCDEQNILYLCDEHKKIFTFLSQYIKWEMVIYLPKCILHIGNLCDVPSLDSFTKKISHTWWLHVNNV